MSDISPDHDHVPPGAAAPGEASDATALVQQVMQESYRETANDLRLMADKVRHHNKQKKALRDYISQLREFRGTVLDKAREAKLDLCHPDAKTVAALKRLLGTLAVSRTPADEDVARMWYELCIPDRVPPPGTDSLCALEDALADFESKLHSVGDDAQLQNLDLQNALQKLQQTLQMLSNISKSQHAVLMAIIGNMK